MPCTFSIVELSRNSGAISTRPPIDTTTRMPIKRTIEFFSKNPWFMIAPSLRRHCRGIAAQLRRRRRCRLLGEICRHVAAYRAPDVDGHENTAQEEQRSAGGTDDVGPVHGLDRLDER